MNIYAIIAIVLLVAIVVAVYLKLAPQSKTPAPASAPEPPPQVSTGPDLPISFGYKTCWLAIRTSDPQAVIDALGLEDVQRANWKNGVGAAYRYQEPEQVFVSPVVDGWVLAVSGSLPVPGGNPGGSEDAWSPLMRKLAAKFEDVQFFGNHRVSDFVAWGRYRNGSFLRAYTFVAETLHNEGEPTAEEVALGIPIPAPGDAESDAPDEESVLQLAEAWSVDPTQLDGKAQALGPGLGWLGRRSTATKVAP